MGGRVARSVTAGLALALLASAPAHAAEREPVRVGAFDMQAKRIVDQDAGVKVVYREFLQPGMKADGVRQGPRGDRRDVGGARTQVDALSRGPAFAGVTDLPVLPGRSASR